jgi:predicted nuclease of predicted toxin-antitoxin system
VTAKKSSLKFFLDENVPSSVGAALEGFGHEVIYLQDAIAKGSSDPLVCTAAQQNQAILVSLDSDMKKLAKRYGSTNGRFKKLSLVKLSCKSTSAVQRISAAMSIISHEWEISQDKTSRRIFVEIGQEAISIKR